MYHIYMDWVQVILGVTLNNVTPPNIINLYFRSEERRVGKECW